VKKTISKHEHRWDLSIFYTSPDDPQLEQDILALEKNYSGFQKRYDTPGQSFLKDPEVFLAAMKEVEKMIEIESKPMRYLYHYRDIDATNEKVIAKMALIGNRLTKAGNAMAFFHVGLGKMSPAQQKRFLGDKRLARYRVYLQRKFDDGKHDLGIGEEKIMALKSLPAYDMWVQANEKQLNTQTVSWKGKNLPIPAALGEIPKLKTHAERVALSKALSSVLKGVAEFSEAELNAVFTNKKINDELRGYRTPYQNTVENYRNDPAAVEALVDAVTGAFPIAHRFYKLKAKLIGQRTLAYADRNVGIGTIQRTFDFNTSAQRFRTIILGLDRRFASIFDSYLAHGQIDSHPRLGKRSGAYCWGSYGHPTFVMLNHTDDFRSFSTLAHEMGHAFHTELSKSQGPIYHDYSTSLAETASTLFEGLAIDAMFDELTSVEKIMVLHDRINDSMSTIFRQIACFNYEKELHETIRTKGFMSKEEIADAHNKHMSAYLGPSFKLDRDDGYYFAHWSHIRNFFYVYSYAYGELVSKAMLRRYKADPSFWSSIKEFLSAGGKDSPENILKEIGIDITKPGFWKEGLQEIENDIDRLEKLIATQR